METSDNVEAIANYHCRCGENPLWDDSAQALYWVDIPAGRIFRYDAASGEHRQIYEGEVAGGFTFQADGSLLLFQANRFSRLDLDTGEENRLVENIDDDMQRFNDVIADPEGRVFAGTIGQDRERGGLYRVDTDGTVTSLFKGSGCANGMAFTQDLKTFYWTCTTRRTIFQFDYDRASGELSNRKALLAVPEGEGAPDGMTIDTDGNLWSARWGGHGVFKFNPAGEPIGKIEFPVECVSSAVFGGPDLNDLYVTTAGGKAGEQTQDGTLYRVRVGAKGLPEFRSRILLD